MKIADAGTYQSRRGKYLTEVCPGEGDAELKNVYPLLDSYGYDGYYSLEYPGNIKAAELIQYLTAAENILL